MFRESRECTFRTKLHKPMKTKATSNEKKFTYVFQKKKDFISDCITGRNFFRS